MSRPRVPACLLLSILAFASPASRAQAAVGCAKPRVLIERFISADCETCWSEGKAPEVGALAIDWIVPSARGEDAPLTAAAIADATPRAGAVSPTRTDERRHVLAPSSEWNLLVEDGPGWNGYIAAQLQVTRGSDPPSEDPSAYIALVERVRAGEEGSPVERLLVRSVAGPLPLDRSEASRTHMRAFRIPLGSKPARLTAIGWLETPGGAVLAAARVEAEGCMPAR